MDKVKTNEPNYLKMDFEVRHDHTNGQHTMTMEWAHGVKMIVELFEGGQTWIGCGDRYTQRDSAEITISRLVELQQECQRMDDGIAKFCTL